ncbi:MAG: DUF4440 domain-containing protein [Bacteroidota bacterium]
MRLMFICFVLVIFGESCKAQRAAKVNQATTFSIEKVKPTIQKLGTTWSKALTTKNLSLLENLYDQNAHYLPNDDQALHGHAAIVAYWKASMDFVGDIQLSMQSLEGTQELLYETGTGVAKIMNEEGQFFDMPFKYVNVWKLQPDGSYKVVIDTYNNPAQ